MAALVVGNGAYRGCGPLKNPVNDAEDIAAKLTSYGFHVLVAMDATRVEMDKQLREFKDLLATNELGLFFFAGHGMQIEGTNYLLAVDTDTSSELDAKHSSLSLDKFIDTMAKSNASMKIVILDACRNNPWERAWHRDVATRGLASVYAPKGTIIGFATSPGEVAEDGLGRNGTYTAALLQHIDTADCSIETMFKRVRNTVAAETRGKQTSWEHTSLSGEFYFNMSLGKIIQDYKGTSLADTLFVVDVTKKSHKIIQGLKTHDWYMQNDALALLNAESASKMAMDSLFVVGRNIYQAACGNAHDAQQFLINFMSVTSSFEKAKRKAILDGMLFEIFFNSKGELRKEIKPLSVSCSENSVISPEVSGQTLRIFSPGFPKTGMWPWLPFLFGRHRQRGGCFERALVRQGRYRRRPYRLAGLHQRRAAKAATT
jgi:Caspase domain